MKISIKKRLITTALIIGGLCIAIRFTAPVNDRLEQAAASAAHSGDLHKLKTLRLLGVDVHKSVPGRGPLLISAAGTGQNKVINYLLASGVNIDTRDKFGGTALSRAAQYGQTETVKLLINSGANVNIQDYEGGNSPLDLHRLNVQSSGAESVIIDSLLTETGGRAFTTHQ
ncbi:MAG: ankyrin repeat domain-containing protein [Pontiellaceae bacterium]|nr:ankyrin repeat domain-containing protein [Pontiellaceae bacterium]